MRFTLSSTLIWFTETTKYWFVAFAFPGLHVSFTVLMLMTAVVNLFTTLPSTPGYVGTFDAPGIAILKAFGVSAELATGYTLVLHAALFENEQGGYGPHAVLLGQFFVVLHVYPGNFSGDGPVPGNGFKHRRHSLARVGPVGPKLNQYGVRGIEHFLVEVRFVQFNDVVVHNSFLICLPTQVSNPGQRG